MITRVRLNGVVESVEATEHHHYDSVDMRSIAVTADPILPEGDWLEVTTHGSEMREFVTIPRGWNGPTA